MISRFFIDRPIFAAVLSIFITLTGGIALLSLPLAQYPPVTPPAVAVLINYPGASAQVVADTVAAPIEQQVNGVEGMLYMSSQMGNDGSYTLTVTFDIGTDLDTALVMVQNRVTLAMPLLPTAVQRQGITIRKKTPDILNIINFYSPDGRYDDVYLSNYATIHVYDELLRIDGVSQINYQGIGGYSIRAWLDPQKLASLNLTVLDVANAIRNQNLDAPAGVLGEQPSTRGQSFELPIDTLGRLTTTEQFGDIIVKVVQAQPRPPSNAPTPPSPSGHRRAHPRQQSAPRRPAARCPTTTACTAASAVAATTSGTTHQHGAGRRYFHRHRHDRAPGDGDDRRRHDRRRRHDLAAGRRLAAAPRAAAAPRPAAAANASGDGAADQHLERPVDHQRTSAAAGTGVLGAATPGPGAGPAGRRHRPPARRGPHRTGCPELQHWL